MSNYQQTIIEVGRIPLPRVLGAYNKYNPSPDIGAKKADCVKWLAEEVYAGRLSMSDILQAPSGQLPSTAPANAVDHDARAVSSQAHTNAKNALNAVGDLAQRVSQLADHLINVESASVKLAKQVGTVAQKVGDFKLDDRALQKAVGEAIAAEFAPFKQAVRDVGAEAVIADLSAVHQVGEGDAIGLFGRDIRNIKGKPVVFSQWNHPDAPEIDPDFIWTDDILRHLSLSDRTGENVWFGGEKGTGKSETARQFAARTGRAFKRINFHKHTCAEEYLGATGLANGATVFEPKDFLTAFTTPSTVILLDEITNADAGELAPLNGLLEPNAAVSYGGRVWRRAAGVLVFAADNTFGNGDETGRHVGTRAQNTALIDRFSRIIPFTFLPAAQEIDAIINRSGCTIAIAEHVHAAIDLAREKVKQAEIVDAPSIRSAIAFCRALQDLSPRDAWETTIVARQPSESAAALRGIYELCISESFIANNL